MFNDYIGLDDFYKEIDSDTTSNIIGGCIESYYQELVSLLVSSNQAKQQYKDLHNI